MVFQAIADFVYKEIPTFTKMNQILANLLAHDHRADGSQGADLQGRWVNASGVSGAAGWRLDSFRYRTVLAGAAVAVDVAVTRTGADLTFAATGNIANTTMLTGVPAAVRETVPHVLLSDAGVGSVGVRFDPDGTADLVHGYPNSNLVQNRTVTIRGLIWRG